ncbi:hypothetical protein GCM10009610_20540 [Pseudonocardia xinjiangensis]
MRGAQAIRSLDIGLRVADVDIAAEQGSHAGILLITGPQRHDRDEIRVFALVGADGRVPRRS